MSETPRTDEQTDHPYNIHLDNDRAERLGNPVIARVRVVDAEFARGLERELNAMRKCALNLAGKESFQREQGLQQLHDLTSQTTPRTPAIVPRDTEAKLA